MKDLIRALLFCLMMIDITIGIAFAGQWGSGRGKVFCAFLGLKDVKHSEPHVQLGEDSHWDCSQVNYTLENCDGRGP